MKKELANFTKLVILVLLVVFAGQWLYFKFGNFAIWASYADFKHWYPKYYIVVYSALWLIKIGLLLGGIYLGKLVVNYSVETYRMGGYDIGQVKNLMKRNNHTVTTLWYSKVFGIAEIVWLAIAIALYFLLPPPYVHNIWYTKVYLVVALTMGVQYLAVNRFYIAGVLKKFFFQPTSAFNLSVYRILFFTYLFLQYKSNLHYHFPYIESKGRVALPYMGWLINAIPVSPSLYYYIATAGMVGCIFLVLGLFTRFFLVLNAFLVFYVIAVPNFYGKLWHGQLPIWISWFLLFANLNARFALDNYLFPKTKNNTFSPNHTFALRIIWLQIGFLYFWAGFHKLWQGGLEWALGPSMINQVRLEWFEHYDVYPFIRIDQYPTLLHIGGVLVILFEIVYPFLLFNKPWRYISIVGGLIMHNILGIFMYIAFFGLQLQYLVFINYEKAYKWLRIKLLNKQDSNEVAPNTSTVISKPLVYLSAGVFGINFLFGLGNISSYPFSVYPTYTEIIPSEKEYLHYEAIDADEHGLNVRDLGRQANFRWEDFSRLDYAIINRYEETGIVDTNAVQESWQWWALKIDTLKSIDTLDVSIVRRSINPDSANIIINKRHLIRLYPNEKP